MPAKKATAETNTLNIVRIRRERITVCVKGATPIILYCLGKKTQRELLSPSGPKTTGQKKTTLKHDPYEEFIDSPRMSYDEKNKTLLQIGSINFKNALCGCAVDLPDSPAKAQLSRSIYVEQDWVNVYGIPYLKMDPVRQADMKRTPDIRTRCAVKEWAARVTLTYAVPLLNGDALVSLLANAGIMQGVGDYRQQKGKGSYGQWEVTEESDPDFKRIIKGGGRAAQRKAMREPECYDDETADLLAWFTETVTKRGFILCNPAERVA